MAVRSATLAHGNYILTAGLTTDLATVPGGEVWLIKDASAFVASTATTMEVRLGVYDGTVNVPFLRAAAASTGDLLLQPGRFVVAEAGDVLRVTAPGNAGTVRVDVSGAKLVV